MKKYICILLSIIISISAAIYNISALTAEAISTVKISLDGNFADDRIIVVFNNKASLSFKEYATEDFDRINIKSIKNISESAGNKVRTAMTNVAEHVTKNVPLVPYEGIPLSNYKQILCLELSTPGKANVVSAIKELQKREEILLAIPDYELVACGLEPTDPDYQSKMNSWAEHIGLEDAWDYASIYFNKEDVPAVRVGIIDSGIDGNHPDLSENLNEQLSQNFTQNTWDSDYDGGIVDELGHGTMCASVVGAVANNDAGVAGVCWNVELVSLKIYDGTHAYSSDVAEAIDSADEKNIDILSLSWRWNIPEDEITYGVYDEALDSFIGNYSGLFVCGAGNDSTDIDNSNIQELPSSYQNIDNKIVVGSSNYDSISEFSNTGADTVDLFAQGEDIYVAYPVSKCNSSNHFDTNFPQELYAHEDDGYHKVSGTSFSAPLVAGVAAIMMCMNRYYLPDHPEVIKSKIYDSVVNPDGNFDGECISGGRLDAFEAVKNANEDNDDNDDDTGDEGPCMHEARYYNYTSTTHTQYCAYCGEQVGTPQMHSLLRMNVFDPTYHNVRCLTCGYIGDELHSASYIHTDSYRHIKYCTVCNYNGLEYHNLYIEEIYGGDDGCEVACQNCSYSFHCDCNPEFGYDDGTGHSIDCPDGAFSIFEEHTWRYEKNNINVHKATCTVCSYWEYQNHTWFYSGTEYWCRSCNERTQFIPGIIMSLSDEELELLLSSMSEEELEAFIALLPEDALARVTAILPSEDDEFLTE